MTRDIGWGILGTAHIAERSFLPALREAGGGRPVAVASRNLAAGKAFAHEHGIERGLEGYGALLDDPQVEAVYVALPNRLHAEWSEAALDAEKAVLCEKPLCGTVEDTEAVLAAARRTGGLLWEAFVFPFHEQIARVRELLSGGVIGDLREIQSSFHFLLADRENVRMSRELQGGSLQDVGCYPIRLARLLFEAEPERGRASAVWSDTRVDEEMAGELIFPGDRRLLFSCGFRLAPDTSTRIMGSLRRIHLSNPFHPRACDTIEVIDDDERTVRPAAVERYTFTPALRHVHAALRGEEEPRHLAVDEALGNARAIAMLARSAREDGEGSAGQSSRLR
jgi:predicted dehydrogenase